MKKEWIKYYQYLEDLRQSGIVNMYGSVPYLQAEFDLSFNDAKEILMSWMRNYDEIIEYLKNNS